MNDIKASATEEQVFSEAIECFRNAANNLMDGGPSVDRNLINEFVSGTLSQSESRRVSRLVLTYKDWFVHEHEARSEMWEAAQSLPRESVSLANVDTADSARWSVDDTVEEPGACGVAIPSIPTGLVSSKEMGSADVEPPVNQIAAPEMQPSDILDAPGCSLGEVVNLLTTQCQIVRSLGGSLERHVHATHELQNLLQSCSRLLRGILLVGLVVLIAVAVLIGIEVVQFRSLYDARQPKATAENMSSPSRTQIHADQMAILTDHYLLTWTEKGKVRIIEDEVLKFEIGVGEGLLRAQFDDPRDLLACSFADRQELWSLREGRRVWLHEGAIDDEWYCLDSYMFFRVGPAGFTFKFIHEVDTAESVESGLSAVLYEHIANDFALAIVDSDLRTVTFNQDLHDFLPHSDEHGSPEIDSLRFLDGEWLVLKSYETWFLFNTSTKKVHATGKRWSKLGLTTDGHLELVRFDRSGGERRITPLLTQDTPQALLPSNSVEEYVRFSELQGYPQFSQEGTFSLGESGEILPFYSAGSGIVTVIAPLQFGGPIVGTFDSGDCRHAIALGVDGTVKRIDVGNQRFLSTIEQCVDMERVRELVADNGLTYLGIFMDEHRLVVWNLVNGKKLQDVASDNTEYEVQFARAVGVSPHSVKRLPFRHMTQSQ